MIDWPAATMIGGAIVLAGALGYTAYRHFSEPWLVQGTWEPAEPAWPQPTLRFVAGFSSLATTTSEDWGFTPSRYFLERTRARVKVTAGAVLPAIGRGAAFD